MNDCIVDLSDDVYCIQILDILEVTSILHNLCLIILYEPMNGESLLNGISEDSTRDVQIENKKNLQEVYYMKQI
jgi:hypothetical protein